MKTGLGAALLLFATLVMLPAHRTLAHHAPYGQYAIDDTIDFTGEVVRIAWENPHALIWVRVDSAVESGVDSAAPAVVYRIELRSPRQLRARGWQGDELEPGASVRVVNAAVGLGAGSRRVCCARIYDLEGSEFFTGPRPAD